MRSGYYLSPVGTVHIYAQNDGHAGSTFGRLDICHAGRDYQLSFEDSPTEQGLMRRCLWFAHQVQQMARQGIKQLGFGEPLPAVGAVPATWPPQPGLFAPATITLAEQLADTDALLNMLQAASNISEAHFYTALSNACRAQRQLREFYGIPEPVATVTAGS